MYNIDRFLYRCFYTAVNYKHISLEIEKTIHYECQYCKIKYCKIKKNKVKENSCFTVRGFNHFVMQMFLKYEWEV